MKTVRIYTDGSCLGNPGPGGWAACLKSDKQYKEISGGTKHTTNNSMELTAILEALKCLKKAPLIVEIYSDSKYAVDAFRKDWISNWKANRFLRNPLNPHSEYIPNAKLWMGILEEVAKHDVYFNWVKGHSEDVMNERCHQLAKAAARWYRDNE